MPDPGMDSTMTSDNDSSRSIHSFHATCPAGTADLLAAELTSFGATRVRERATVVEFEGSLETGYRACLWSRCASRVVLRVRAVPARTADELYRGVQSIQWSAHLALEGTFLVDFTGGNPHINNSHFGALRVKDAVVDQFRQQHGSRPSINSEQPDLTISVHLHADTAIIGIDLSGTSLHRRNYRGVGGAAPLKENLAAALLLRSGWADIAARGGAFVDPMCGSGTLPIEAALIAGDIAPGLLREYFGFNRWLQHNTALWSALREEAMARRSRGADAIPRIQGFDRDPAAVAVARVNAANAGLADIVTFERFDVAQLEGAFGEAGLMVTNPPYGERLGEADNLRALYASLGETLRTRFLGWRAAVLTGNPSLAHAIGLRATRNHTLFNGAIECRLLRFEVNADRFDLQSERPSRDERMAEARQRPGASMFANRLTKNLKGLTGWAEKEGIRCYRVYDADMPEYAFAIDLYEADPRCICVQEYEAPDSIDRKAAGMRRMEALSVLPEVFGIDAAQVHVRTRRRQKDAAQYQKQDDVRRFTEVEEGGLRFLVNFTDYLDTGLFLDHRLTRKRIGELARGKHFLNLFAYTGSATVNAAAGGAASTLTVDMSNTYLDWAQRNMALNGFVSTAHNYLREDVLQWLRSEAGRGRPGAFDLIFIDPPTFSRGKRMEVTFDVQRDHVRMLKNASRLLRPGGVIVFSNNFTRFKLDYEALPEFEIEDVSKATIPKDFARSPRIHCCYVLKVA